MSKLLELIRQQRQPGSSDGDKLEPFLDADGQQFTDERERPLLVSGNMLRLLLREIDGTTRGVPPSQIAGTARTVPQR